MAKQVDPDDLIAADEVASLIGLNNPGGVAVYRRRHADFPEPAVVRGRCVLWLRADIATWAKAHHRRSVTDLQLATAFTGKFADALDSRDELIPDTLPYAIVHGDQEAARLLCVEIAVEHGVGMPTVLAAFDKFAEDLELTSSVIDSINEL